MLANHKNTRGNFQSFSKITSKTKIYDASNPQNPYQKVTVEKTNGLIRQFFTKLYYKGKP